MWQGGQEQAADPGQSRAAGAAHHRFGGIQEEAGEPIEPDPTPSKPAAPGAGGRVRRGVREEWKDPRGR